MKSIRLSLIVYFLILLAAALGAVSWFCYQSTKQALDAKEASTSELLVTRYKDTTKQVSADFDRDLISRAKVLSEKLDQRVVWVRHHAEPLYVLGLINSNLQQQGHLQVWLWAAETFHPWFAWRLRGPEFRMLPPDEDEMLMGQGEYYQINNAITGRPLARSDNLPTWLAVSDEQRKRANWEGQAHVDSVARGATAALRRVTLVRFLGRTRDGVLVGPWPAGPGPKVGELFPRGGPARQRPPVLFQYANETIAREETLAKLKQDLDRDLANLQEDLGTNLAELRTNLLWISLGTFLALVGGGLFLIWIGLAPLHRLSEAVSKVSPRDFRLPVDPTRLPKELQPIAGRLAQTLEELKRAFAREKQAAADISHELRTPLATLLTTIDVALNKPRSPEQYREVLDDCRTSGQHMNQLVERLLKLARLDAGGDYLRPREVDVTTLAEQCADMVRPLARARGLDLRVHTNGPATIQADPDKLREVLNNLLHNAIDYNKPNGTVDLTVARDNGHLVVEVRDTGIGIPPEARDRIFERFFRADPSRHAEGMHAGLGLAIVKGYVDLMGGTIGVDSGPGGSTFRVDFPAA